MPVTTTRRSGRAARVIVGDPRRRPHGPVTREPWLGAEVLSYPNRPRTILDALDRAVRLFPDRTYLVAPEGELTYRELAELVEGASERLVEEGLVAGDRLAVAARNGVDLAVALWACARIGAVLVGLNIRLTPAQWEYILEHSGAAAACRTGWPSRRWRPTSSPVPTAEMSAAVVQQWVRTGMADYAAPRFVHLVDEIPRNSIGKIDKPRLRPWRRIRRPADDHRRPAGARAPGAADGGGGDRGVTGGGAVASRTADEGCRRPAAGSRRHPATPIELDQSQGLEDAEHRPDRVEWTSAGGGGVGMV